MHLERFSFRRFGSFDREISIPIDNYTVLVGPNNLGKSTILRAQHIFFQSLGRSPGSRLFRSPSYRSRVNYQPELDYPKKYEGRRGRRWSTRMIGEFVFSEDDRQSCVDETAIEIPAQTTVVVEFGTEGDRMASRTIQCAEVPEDDHRQFFRWLLSGLRFVYIPAARGANFYRAALFGELVSGAITRTKRNRQRLDSLQKFHADAAEMLQGLQTQLAEHLRNYLPDVQSVEFELSEPDLLDFLSVDSILVDDGARTKLEQKGDGFRSLFELAVLQFVAEQQQSAHLIFAIEEPESHLHPSAIYDVKSTLRSLSRSFQVLLTTHSPILIRRDSMSSNVLVRRAEGQEFACTATPARTLSQIRESLGIRPQDNLATAAVVVVVEGVTEEVALSALLTAHSDEMARAIHDGKVRVLGTGGASKTPSVLRSLVRDASSCVVLLDSDTAGETARAGIVDVDLVAIEDLFSVPPRTGCLETEFEDMFEPEVYVNAVFEACGIVGTPEDFVRARTQSGSRRTRMEKWSVVMQSLVESHGRRWENCELLAKEALAKSIAEHADTIAQRHDPLIQSMTARILAYLEE